jgi:hypothetical protein
MPTILRNGPYRVYFYSHEPNERPMCILIVMSNRLSFGLIQLL